MAKLRKRPIPADAEPKAEPVAQAVTVLPPIPAPPPVEHKPIVTAEPAIPFPRTPEEVIHNVILRQLEDDLEDPPEPEPENPLIVLLKKVQKAKDTGQPLAVYAEEASRLLQGLDAEEKFTVATVRHARLREIAEGLETRTAINRFLRRLFKRGDLTPREALVFKQLTEVQLETQVKALTDSVKSGTADAVTPEDFTRMDWSRTLVEKTSVEAFKGITAQEREIVRKITITARRKIYQENIE